MLRELGFIKEAGLLEQFKIKPSGLAQFKSGVQSRWSPVDARSRYVWNMMKPALQKQIDNAAGLASSKHTSNYNKHGLIRAYDRIMKRGGKPEELAGRIARVAANPNIAHG